MATNKEFYGDKLMAAALYRGDGCRVVHELKYGKSCYGKACCNCDIYTTEGVLEWLNAEHGEPEPPLLENGDGLKPGDWVMVRYDDDAPWTKTQFLAYIDGVFYTREPLNGGTFKLAVYYQARLPMEGE